MKELRMRKSGLFYETFDEDAVIMHYLFNYKIIDERVAFPTNSLDKVINALNEQEIDYLILIIGASWGVFMKRLWIKNEFGESNSYLEILKKAENKREAEDRLNELLPKLEILDKVTLDSVLTEFETKVASF